MTDISLSKALDEVIILHGGVAETLLNEFPETNGASFHFGGRPGAHPRMKVPKGYIDTYSDPVFEARAADLMSKLSSKMEQFNELLSSVKDRTSALHMSAIRHYVKGTDQTASGAMTVGAISGGLGSIFIKRTVLAGNGRVIAAGPMEFGYRAITESDEAQKALARAAKLGPAAVMDHLIETNQMLHSKVAKEREIKGLRKWLAHFDAHAGEAMIDHDISTSEISYASERQRFYLAVQPNDTLTETPSDFVIIFDPITGLVDGEPTNAMTI